MAYDPYDPNWIRVNGRLDKQGKVDVQVAMALVDGVERVKRLGVLDRQTAGIIIRETLKERGFRIVRK